MYFTIKRLDFLFFCGLLPLKALQSIAMNDLQLTFYSSPQCGICVVLKPKIQQMLAASFPQVAYKEVDITAQPAEAAQHRVFALPVVTLDYEGRELARWVRSFSIQEIRQQVERLVGLMEAE